MVYKVPYYIKVYQVCWERISRCEEGRHFCGRIYHKKMKREAISSSGKGEEHFGKKIKILKNGCVEKNQVVGNFIHP